MKKLATAILFLISVALCVPASAGARVELPAGDDADALTKELRDWVAKEVGAIAKPDQIRYADNLPKTRSGKIMRRLLRTIAKGEEITSDTSTLENEAILDQLRGRD